MTAKGPGTDSEWEKSRQPFHIMAKPIGFRCQLACSYCFYLEKEVLHASKGSCRMSPETLDLYIRQYLASQPGFEVEFAWQGGEPTLLGLDFFRKVVELQNRHGGDRIIRNAFQTNGLLLDKEWAKFFRENAFLVGVSIDGPPHLHNVYRVDRQGRGTGEQVVANWKMLLEEEVEANTLTCVGRHNFGHGREVYCFLREIGSRFPQFIPLVERVAPPADKRQGWKLARPPRAIQRDSWQGEVTSWSVPPEGFGNFLIAVFHEWMTHDVGVVFVQAFEEALGQWMGYAGTVCVHQPRCGRALAIEHNGDVYACDHYVYPRYRRGNIHKTSLTDMVDGTGQVEFGDAKETELSETCRSCPYLFACRGDCPKHRFVQLRKDRYPTSYLCAGFKKWYSHMDPWLQRMAQLHRQGRPVSEIMREIPTPALDSSGRLS